MIKLVTQTLVAAPKVAMNELMLVVLMLNLLVAEFVVVSNLGYALVVTSEATHNLDEVVALATQVDVVVHKLLVVPSRLVVASMAVLLTTVMVLSAIQVKFQT